MKRSLTRLLILCIATLCISAGSAYSQSNEPIVTDSSSQAMYSVAWLKDLYEPGVSMKADSLVINKEAERLLQDASYRQTLYPTVYTWEAAAGFIQKQEIKKAIWYFINLYTINDQNKELVIKSILVYNKIFKMDKALLGSFYTYSFTDPEIGKIENGHSEITAPHIMEKKLNALKQMLFYLDKYKSADTKDAAKKE